MLEQASDDFLIRRYAGHNDRDALGVLFRRHADAAYSTALRICRNSADAQDVVQSVFTRMMATASSYRGGSEFAVKAWLMKSIVWTSKNKIRTEVRRRNREDAACEENSGTYVPDADTEQEDCLKQRTAEVLEALDEMPGQYRDVMLLHYFNGIPVKDASAALNMPEKTFRNTLEYGVRKLRFKLKERRINATASAVALALTVPAMEKAPASLLNQIKAITGPAAQQLISSHAASSGAFLLKWTAYALILAGLGLAVYAVRHPKMQGSAPSRITQNAIASPTRTMLYSWDFNKPGIPPELVCTKGTVRHIPDGGPDGKGCLELTGKESRIVINVPVTSFPIVVKWRSSWIAATPHIESASKSFWFPARDVATFLNVGHIATTDPAHRRTDIWRNRTDYHSGSYIDRWLDNERSDMTIGKPEPSGKLILCFFSDYRIDDLTVAGISAEELPPAANYLKALERIPAHLSQGYVDTPELQSAERRKPAQIYFRKGLIDEATALGPPAAAR